LQDLADYLDQRRKVAHYEARAFRDIRAPQGD
jgi:hypothetical protein